jgi:alpha-ketoglutarate-dependent taurine dioxygenase
MSGPSHFLITTPDAWIGEQMQSDPAWILRLDDEALQEIDDALQRVKRRGLCVPFAKADFSLPTVSPLLGRVLHEIEHGRGFQLIRGIPRGRYSDADCELLYWGLGLHFGTPVSQSARGHLLGHVRDEGRVIADPNARAYQTNQRMDFHTDMLPIDVLGLFCMRTAKSGGASKLTSALTVHNVLREERPDLLDALYGEFHLDWRGEEPAGEQPWFVLPMYSKQDGCVTARICSLAYFESAARFGEQHRLKPVQREALEAVQAIANRPALMLSMSFEEGDIQLINNHTMLHAREAYIDYEEPVRQRHLLRMWIAVDDARRRPLAAALHDRYRWVERGGIPAKALAA